MLEFENVSKSYWTGKRRKVILANASFQVRAGNSLGILAPNGTGKTTLINMMSGLEKPDEGAIRRFCKVSFPLSIETDVPSVSLPKASVSPQWTKDSSPESVSQRMYMAFGEASCRYG